MFSGRAGISGFHPELLRRVVFQLPCLKSLWASGFLFGVAWLVVVAAEMIALIQARLPHHRFPKCGQRYDLVVSGILLIGTIGLCLTVQSGS